MCEWRFNQGRLFKEADHTRPVVLVKGFLLCNLSVQRSKKFISDTEFFLIFFWGGEGWLRRRENKEIIALHKLNCHKLAFFLLFFQFSTWIDGFGSSFALSANLAIFTLSCHRNASLSVPFPTKMCLIQGQTSKPSKRVFDAGELSYGTVWFK